MWASVGNFTVTPLRVTMLGVWTVVIGALAVWAYRREEGRRFA